jgi:MFS family permease
MLGAAVLQPLNGVLLDRLGGRAVLLAGLFCAGLALIGTSFATELWQLALFMGIGSSVGYAAVSPVSATSIVSSWFERGRGTALGVATSGTKVAMVVLPTLLALSITANGWRLTMLLLGAAVWLLIPAVVLFMQHAPGSVAALRRQRRSGGPEKSEGPQAEALQQGSSFREALLLPTFWIIAFALFANGMIMNLVFIHLPSYVIEAGYSEGVAATGLAILGALGIVGTMATGAASDRMGRRNVLLLMFAARGATALFVILAPGPLSMLAFVAVFGLLGYGAIAVIGAMASDLFGRRAVGAILGTAYVANQIGGAVGTYAGGASLEITGDYSASLWLAVATTLLSFGAILFIRDGSVARASGASAELPPARR